MKESKATIRVTCAICGKKFLKWKCYAKRTKEHFCSYQCNGVRRGQDWAKHGHKGARARTPESYAKAAMRGSKNPAWKGGVTFKRNKGNYIGPKYVRCPPDLMEMARKDGYVMEHRIVMARLVGRPLLRTECVHHKDHNTRNNAPENLELFENNGAHKRAEGERARSAGALSGSTDMGQP